MEQNRLFSVCVSEQRWTLVRYRLRHFRYRTCIVQPMFLLLLLLLLLFSSSELTLSRIKSVLFLCFFVSTHKFSVVHDLRQMFLYQGRILKHFLKDFFCRRLKIIITAWRGDK